jgi:hypothetical protein
MCFPLLFDLCYTKNEHLLEQYELMDQMVEADVVIVPIDISEYFQKKQQVGSMTISTKLWDYIKKVWVYSAGDFGLSINKAVYTFRSGFDSKMDANTFVIPSFIEDPYITIQKNFNLLLKSISQNRLCGSC